MNERYVLISFWSANDEASVRNVIEMKPVYERFKNKGFEIYQVAVDKSIETVEKRVYFEELSWINVVDTAYPNSLTRRLYNVNQVPMNYLIDKEKEEILVKNTNASSLEKLLNNLL